MADSIAEQIIDVVIARLQTITTGGGYNTDPAVHRNRPALDADGGDALPAMVVQEQQESATELAIGGRIRNQYLISVHCFTRGDLNAIVADVKKAVFLNTGRNLSGLAEDLRYEGWRRQQDEIATEIQVATIEMTAVYDENYGDPYTAL